MTFRQGSRKGSVTEMAGPMQPRKTLADQAGSDLAGMFAGLADAFPISAAPFVVTLYGDVVA
ncbi:hypothetical protein, partial [Candidatus Skiveiella danica]|uniref:hypothetical protein n=1 Tax=Candidatus Skiveiella danica TaxID=3386177 RepID=UPI0039B8976A